MTEAQECQHPGRNLVGEEKMHGIAPISSKPYTAWKRFAHDLLKCHPPCVMISGQQTIKPMANRRNIQSSLHKFGMFHSSTKGVAERFRNSIFSAAINPDAISLFVVSCLIQKNSYTERLRSMQEKKTCTSPVERRKGRQRILNNYPTQGWNSASLRKPPKAHKIRCPLKCESVSTKLIPGPLLWELTWLQIVANNDVNRNTWNTIWKLRLRQNTRTKVSEMITDYWLLITVVHLLEH